MKKDYSMEDIFAAKLREARRKYEGRTLSTGDMPLTAALREYVTGDMSPALRSLSQATRDRCAANGTAYGIGLMYPMETRSISTISSKSATITEEIFDLLGGIRNKLVLNQVGAQFITGLKGDIGFVTYSGATVEWADEVGYHDESSGEFTRTTLSPKRLTAYVDVSKELLLQCNEDLDKFLINDFAAAIASELQAAILGDHTHDDKKPDGLFTGATLKMTGPVDYKKIVGLQAEVYDNALNYAYITNNAGYAKLKGTLKVKDAAEGFIIDKFDKDPNNYCADFPLFRTNDVPDIDGEHGIIFGDFSELVIGQWGDLDITVDPYTQATSGMIRLVVNSWFDAAVRRKNAIALGSFS